jgi:hypothetical protein
MDEASGLEDRLQQLLAKRGQELVRGLIDELNDLRREIAELRREIAALHAYQAKRDRWLVAGEAVPAAPLPRLAVIEPDHLLRAEDGFYPTEYTMEGTPFRWTGPTPQFSFDVFVERSQGADVKLQALNCIDYEVQSKVKLLVDGVDVPLEVTPEGSGFVAAGSLPRNGAGRSTNLLFVLPAVLLPPESEDTRLLGIAFGKLVVAAPES